MGPRFERRPPPDCDRLAIWIVGERQEALERTIWVIEIDEQPVAKTRMDVELEALQFVGTSVSRSKSEVVVCTTEPASTRSAGLAYTAIHPTFVSAIDESDPSSAVVRDTNPRDVKLLGNNLDDPADGQLVVNVIVRVEVRGMYVALDAATHLSPELGEDGVSLESREAHCAVPPSPVSEFPTVVTEALAETDRLREGRAFRQHEMHSHSVEKVPLVREVACLPKRVSVRHE
jgi:hypothetical protein